MFKLLAFWGVIFWFCLEVWITDPDSKAARIVEVITGIIYLVGSSLMIAFSETPLMALAGSVVALLGIYHVLGASKDELPPWDDGVNF